MSHEVDLTVKTPFFQEKITIEFLETSFMLTMFNFQVKSHHE